MGLKQNCKFMTVMCRYDDIIKANAHTTVRSAEAAGCLMGRGKNGEAEVEQLIATCQRQKLTGEAANADLYRFMALSMTEDAKESHNAWRERRRPVDR